MVTTITAGGSVIAPAAVTEYESARAGGTLLHDILDRADPDVTLRPAGLRSGRMNLIFTGPAAEADSASAEELLAVAGVFGMTSDIASLSMSFVIPRNGSIRRGIGRTGGSWFVTVDWREVPS